MQAKIKTIDFTIFIIPLIFLVVSVAVIYSLVMGTNNDGLWLKQGIIGSIGLVVMVLIGLVDYRHYRGTAWIFYLVSIILLIFVDLFGKTVNGAMNWIDLKVFRLEPSEIAKVALIVSLAAFLSKRVGRIRWRDIFLSLMIFLVPLAFVLKQPDLGTASVLCFIYFAMLFLSKPTRGQIATFIATLLIAFTIFGLAYNKVEPFGQILREYQRQRINVFLHPELDPYGEGYNVKQAQITVGSGGLLGAGLGKGSQSQLQFLPEAHTDFIFAGIAESFGFTGSFLLLAIYCYFLIRLVEIAALSRDNFGMLIIFGIVAMFFFQVLVSVGMDLGLLPVTGIPMPLISYGGTSLIVSFFSIGMAQSVFIRHKKIAF